MNLKAFKIIGYPNNFKPKVSNRLLNLFSTSKDNIEITNIAQLNDNFNHIVFSLEDTLYSGTQKSGISKKIPFNQTVNVFVSEHVLYVEHKSNSYTNAIADFLKLKYHFLLDDLVFNNEVFRILKMKFEIQIIDIYFIDEYGDKLGELNLLNEYNIENLPKDVHIKHITFQIPKVSKGFITIYKEGNINLNLNSVKEFEKFLNIVNGELINA